MNESIRFRISEPLLERFNNALDQVAISKAGYRSTVVHSSMDGLAEGLCGGI